MYGPAFGAAAGQIFSIFGLGPRVAALGRDDVVRRATWLVWEQIFGPLDAESADRVYLEFIPIGATLQMPATLWPATREGFGAYWRERVATVDVTAEARRIAHDLLHPRVAPWWLQPLLPRIRLVTVGLLPPRLAQAYGLVLSPKGKAHFEAWMRRARLVSRTYPAGCASPRGTTTYGDCARCAERKSAESKQQKPT